MRALGPIFNALRKAKGIGQVEWAKAINMTQAFVSKFENGLTDPSFSSLEALSAPLDKTDRPWTNMVFFVFLTTTLEDLPKNKKYLFPEVQAAQVKVIKSFVSNEAAAQKAIRHIINMPDERHTPDEKISRGPKKPRAIEPNRAAEIESDMTDFQTWLDHAYKNLQRDLSEMPENESILICNFENELDKMSQEKVLGHQTAELRF